jgi:hypothetical protein
LASVLFGDDDRRAMQVHGAAVVSETGPLLYHRPWTCSGTRRRIRESFEKLVIAIDDTGDLCLLQHQFGNKNSPRVARVSPRKIIASTCRPVKDGSYI